MKIAVLTSGGVAPGMNAAIRAAAQAAFARPVKRSELWGLVQRGGTALGTGRSPEFEEEEGARRRP